MQIINQYHQDQAKQDRRDARIVGFLFGLTWVLSAALIISAQVR